MKIRINGSLAHLAEGMKPSHGPQVWPWWRLFGLGPVRLDVHPPTTGYRLWLYTRWGAGYVDVFFDRR